ncbi:MAG: NfeD family protein [Bryobacteraceae bacterium]
MQWWIWMLAGLVLLLAEVLTPGGFFLLFFGCGAIVTGALAASGLLASLWAEGLAFCGLSILAILFFRRPLKERFTPAGPGMPVDTLVGELALASQDIAGGGSGKVELRGTTWSARNAGPAPIANRQRCRVERVEGLTLFVRAD